MYVATRKPGVVVGVVNRAWQPTRRSRGCTARGGGYHLGLTLALAFKLPVALLQVCVCVPSASVRCVGCRGPALARRYCASVASGCFALGVPVSSPSESASAVHTYNLVLCSCNQSKATGTNTEPCRLCVGFTWKCDESKAKQSKGGFSAESADLQSHACACAASGCIPASKAVGAVHL